MKPEKTPFEREETPPDVEQGQEIIHRVDRVRSLKTAIRNVLASIISRTSPRSQRREQASRRRHPIMDADLLAWHPEHPTADDNIPLDAMIGGDAPGFYEHTEEGWFRGINGD